MNDELKEAIGQFAEASRKAKEPRPLEELLKDSDLTLRQKADDFFAVNPKSWFVVVGGCLFARSD